MAEETKTEALDAADQTAAAQSGQPTGQAEPGQGNDWEARYRDVLAQSRKWEERSKANADKARERDLLAESHEKAVREAQEARERAEHAEKLLAEANARIERDAMVAEVAAKTGVPAHLLHGTTVEELTECADGIARFAASGTSGYPRDKGGPSSSTPVTRSSIEATGDPVARVMARAHHIDLYS